MARSTAEWGKSNSPSQFFRRNCHVSHYVKVYLLNTLLLNVCLLSLCRHRQRSIITYRLASMRSARILRSKRYSEIL